MLPVPRNQTPEYWAKKLAFHLDPDTRIGFLFVHDDLYVPNSWRISGFDKYVMAMLERQLPREIFNA